MTGPIRQWTWTYLMETMLNNNWKNDWTARRSAMLDTCGKFRNELLQACHAPGPAMDRVLTDCVKRHSDTAFGRQYGFKRIKTVEDYVRAVPIHRYEDLEPWITRTIEGEKKVLTVDEPYMMLKTSGTTGPSKAIPHTAFWRHQHRGPAIYALWGTYAKYFPQIFDHPHATMDFLWEREKPDTFTGKFPHQGISNREIALGGNDFTPLWYDAPWHDFTNDSSGFMERIYLRIRHFIGKDLRAIVCIQPNRLLMIADMLSKEAGRLIEDVRNGELWGQKLFAPNPLLAGNLESLAKKDGTLLPKSVWPNLDLIVCWKSKALELYLQEIPPRYPDTAIIPLLTGATEAIISCPIDLHPTAGILAMNQGLYEFIPQDENDPQPIEKDTPTLSYNQLTEKKAYSVVLTQANGLYRYAIGDIYRVAGYYRGIPRLTFVRRQGIYSSFNGEKLIESQVMEAFRAAIDALALPSGLWACCPVWANPPHYTFIVETAPDWPLDRLNHLAKEINRQLGRHNSNYGERIRHCRLAPATVATMPKGTFQKHWDARVAKGASAPQLKHHFCQKDAMLLKELELLATISRVPAKT